MYRKIINITLLLLLYYPVNTTAEQKKSELELILEKLEGTPTPTPEIKSEYERMADEMDAMHQKSVERSQERKRQERERKLAEARATPTPDPFLERMDKLINTLNSLRSENNDSLRLVRNKSSDLSRQKSSFENGISQRKRYKLLTNSDQNWINGLVRTLESKYNTSTNTLSNYLKTLEQNETQINECLTLAKNFKRGVSDDVARDKQRLSSCDSSITRIGHSLTTTKTAIDRINLENEYKVNLASVDATIKRRESEDRQRNFFGKKR